MVRGGSAISAKGMIGVPGPGGRGAVPYVFVISMGWGRT